MHTPVNFAEQHREFVAAARAAAIAELELHAPPLKSMVEYSTHEPVPTGFLRPEDHFVIADHLIDLPVLAVDLSGGSQDTGPVFAYAYDKYWLVADSLRDFTERIRSQGDAAMWGKDDPRPNQAMQRTADRPYA